LDLELNFNTTHTLFPTFPLTFALSSSFFLLTTYISHISHANSNSLPNYLRARS
jgi:hypothetical protein